jgi:hypothetical protein
LIAGSIPARRILQTDKDPCGEEERTDHEGHGCLPSQPAFRQRVDPQTIDASNERRTDGRKTGGRQSAPGRARRQGRERQGKKAGEGETPQGRERRRRGGHSGKKEEGRGRMISSLDGGRCEWIWRSVVPTGPIPRPISMVMIPVIREQEVATSARSTSHSLYFTPTLLSFLGYSTLSS